MFAITAAKFAAERRGSEAIAIGVGVTVVTGFLFVWLRRLMNKSDGHRDHALP
jgi:hypothetical protein